jgi:threonine dehydratase
MFTLEELEAAEQQVRRAMPTTPTLAWPLLARRTGVDVRVKHENHTPVGAFKIRGGIVYIEELLRTDRAVPGLITATRGNHGQSIARAATAAGLEAVILVPHGNSREKNAAMRALGATVIEHGRDFDEAREEAGRLAAERGLVMVPSFHPALARGVATYALEMFREAPDLDTVYVPIGMGSGICGLIRTRDLLGLSTKIVGVVAEQAPAVALSFEAGRAVSTNSAATFADGMACRVPNEEALAVIMAGADRIVRVSEEGIADAIRFYFEDTHNLAEGAGAAPLAALMSERERMAGKKVGLVLSGSNMDRPMAAEVLAGGTPTV